MLEISDDPVVIRPALEECRTAFLSQKTKDLKFREHQLRSLLRGLHELEPKFHEALRLDLGASKFTSELTSTRITMSEVEHNLKSFKCWAKQRQIDTPLVIGPGKTWIVPQPKGIVLVISAWNYPLYVAIPPVA